MERGVEYCNHRSRWQRSLYLFEHGYVRRDVQRSQLFQGAEFVKYRRCDARRLHEPCATMHNATPNSINRHRRLEVLADKGKKAADNLFYGVRRGLRLKRLEHGVVRRHKHFKLGLRCSYPLDDPAS